MPYMYWIRRDQAKIDWWLMLFCWSRRRGAKLAMQPIFKTKKIAAYSKHIITVLPDGLLDFWAPG